MPISNTQPPTSGVKNFLNNVWQPWNAAKGHRAGPIVGFIALTLLSGGLFAVGSGIATLVKHIIKPIGQTSSKVQSTARSTNSIIGDRLVIDPKTKISMLLTTLKAIEDGLRSPNLSRDEVKKLLNTQQRLERELASLGVQTPSMEESVDPFDGVEFGPYQGAGSVVTGHVIDDLRAKIADLEEHLKFDEEFTGSVDRDFLNAEKNRLETLEGLNREISSLKDFIAGLESRIANLPTEETLSSLQEGTKEYEEVLTQFLEKATLEQEKVNLENSLDEMIKGFNALAATPSSITKETEIPTETNKPIVRVGKPHTNYGEGLEETDAMILSSEKLGTLESEELEKTPEKTVFEQAKEKMGGFVKSVSDFAQEKVKSQEAQTAWANRMADAAGKSKEARILYEQIEDLEAKANHLGSAWSPEKEAVLKDAIRHADDVIEGRVDVENYDPSHWTDIRNKAVEELGHLNIIHWELEGVAAELQGKRNEWTQLMNENK